MFISDFLKGFSPHPSSHTTYGLASFAGWGSGSAWPTCSFAPGMPQSPLWNYSLHGWAPESTCLMHPFTSPDTRLGPMHFLFQKWWANICFRSLRRNETPCSSGWGEMSFPDSNFVLDLRKRVGKYIEKAVYVFECTAGERGVLQIRADKIHGEWCICCSNLKDKCEDLCKTAVAENLPKYLSLQDSCNVVLVLFNCKYFSYVPCEMARLRDLSSLLIYLLLSYLSWIKTQRKLSKISSALCSIFQWYWLFLLVFRIDRGPAHLPWEGECGLQA